MLLYESGDSIRDADLNNRKYVHGTPSELPLYCEEFRKSIPINKSLKIIQCKGSYNNMHYFIEDEGYVLCVTCKETICNNYIANITTSREMQSSEN